MPLSDKYKMDDFHCESLDLRLTFPPEEIDRELFLKAAEAVSPGGAAEDDDGNIDLGASFGSLAKPPRHHAHLRVRLYKDRDSRADFSFHKSPEEIDDEGGPPYLEDCVRWFGEFLTTDSVKARVTAEFSFDSSFSPAIALPFPLVTANKQLAGALVTGLSVLFPGESPQSAIIQSAGDEVYVYFSCWSDISPSTFDWIAELRKISGPVNALVRKQEVSNEKSDEVDKD
jgi:hypothetical protein